MPEVIAEFQKTYPNITVELVEEANDALYQLLLNKEIDLAIANFPSVLLDVMLQNFYEEEIILLISTQLFQQTYGADSEACEQELQGGLKNKPCKWFYRRKIWINSQCSQTGQR